MRARKYNKQIEVWQTTKISDGFGGNGVTDELITKSWCKLITNNKGGRDTDFGITETSNQIIIQLRKRNDITYNSKTIFFKLNGVVYNIITEPIDVNFEGKEIQITLQKYINKDVETIEPINGGNGNNYGNGFGGFGNGGGVGDGFGGLENGV